MVRVYDPRSVPPILCTIGPSPYLLIYLLPKAQLLQTINQLYRQLVLLNSMCHKCPDQENWYHSDLWFKMDGEEIDYRIDSDMHGVNAPPLSPGAIFDADMSMQTTPPPSDDYNGIKASNTWDNSVKLPAGGALKYPDGNGVFTGGDKNFGVLFQFGHHPHLGNIINVYYTEVPIAEASGLLDADRLKFLKTVLAGIRKSAEMMFERINSGYEGSQTDRDQIYSAITLIQAGLQQHAIAASKKEKSMPLAELLNAMKLDEISFEDKMSNLFNGLTM